MILSLNDIVNSSDLKTKVVNVPEWGGDIKIKELSAGQRNELAGMFKDEEIPENYQARLLVMALVDDNGKPIATESDIDKLNAKNGEVVTRIVSEIQELSGMGAEVVEEAEKN